MATWTIQGEAGKTLDATSRTLADINATSAKITFRSCGADTLVLSLELDDFTSSANVPELTQTVSLFRDGTRFFHGIVTSNPVTIRGGNRSVQIVVSGPWWQAENSPLTFSQSDGIGVSKERPSATYPSGNTMHFILGSIIDRSVTHGIPRQKGTISTYFAIPQITFNQMTFGQAITECVRLIPDAMTAVDYATSPPTLSVTRRGVATTRTVTIGADEIASFDVAPVLQLKVEQIRVPYTVRAANGRKSYQEQASGTPAVGKVGVTVVSGPELDTFLPDESYESVQIRTVSTGAISSAFEAMVKETSGLIAGLRNQYGEQWPGGSVVGSNGWISTWRVAGGEIVQYHASAPSSSSTAITFRTPQRSIINVATGSSVSGHLVYPGITLPDWAIQQLGAVKVTFSYMDYVVLQWKDPNPQPTNQLEGLQQYSAGAARLENYYSTFGSFYNRISIFSYQNTVDAYVIQSSYPSLTTVNKPGQYGFVAPPANFAANLLAAQSDIPYEGRIELVSDDVGAIRYSGCKVNVANSIAAHATMGAMVSSEELDILTGFTSITLGAPPRIDYKTFMDKTRHSPQDNVIISI